MGTLAQDVERALKQNADADTPTLKAAIEGELDKHGIGPADTKTSNFLWKTLVVGLTVGLLASLAGLLFGVLDANPATTTDVIVTAFTAILTGLLGLFVKSPLQSNSG